MKYKMFVSDFDGTLVRKDGTVSEENRRAIEAFRKKGGVFAVCSGRMLPSILPRVRELGLGGIVGAIQGAILAEIDTGKIIRCNAFSPLCALRAVTAAERRGLHTHIYTEDQFYSNMDDVFLEFYEKICGVRAERPREPLSSLLSGLKPIVKVIVMLEKEKRDGVYRELKEELGQALRHPPRKVRRDRRRSERLRNARTGGRKVRGGKRRRKVKENSRYGALVRGARRGGGD